MTMVDVHNILRRHLMEDDIVYEMSPDKWDSQKILEDLPHRHSHNAGNRQADIDDWRTIEKYREENGMVEEEEDEVDEEGEGDPHWDPTEEEENEAMKPIQELEGRPIPQYWKSSCPFSLIEQPSTSNGEKTLYALTVENEECLEIINELSSVRGKYSLHAYMNYECEKEDVYQAFDMQRLNVIRQARKRWLNNSVPILSPEEEHRIGIYMRYVLRRVARGDVKTSFAEAVLSKALKFFSYISPDTRIKHLEMKYDKFVEALNEPMRYTTMYHYQALVQLAKSRGIHNINHFSEDQLKEKVAEKGPMDEYEQQSRIIFNEQRKLHTQIVNTKSALVQDLECAEDSLMDTLNPNKTYSICSRNLLIPPRQSLICSKGFFRSPPPFLSRASSLNPSLSTEPETVIPVQVEITHKTSTEESTTMSQRDNIQYYDDDGMFELSQAGAFVVGRDLIDDDDFNMSMDDEETSNEADAPTCSGTIIAIPADPITSPFQRVYQVVGAKAKIIRPTPLRKSRATANKNLYYNEDIRMEHHERNQQKTSTHKTGHKNQRIVKEDGSRTICPSTRTSTASSSTFTIIGKHPFTKKIFSPPEPITVTSEPIVVPEHSFLSSPVPILQEEVTVPKTSVQPAAVYSKRSMRLDSSEDMAVEETQMDVSAVVDNEEQVVIDDVCVSPPRRSERGIEKRRVDKRECRSSRDVVMKTSQSKKKVTRNVEIKKTKKKKTLNERIPLMCLDESDDEEAIVFDKAVAADGTEYNLPLPVHEEESIPVLEKTVEDVAEETTVFDNVVEEEEEVPIMDPLETLMEEALAITQDINIQQEESFMSQPLATSTPTVKKVKKKGKREGRKKISLSPIVEKNNQGEMNHDDPYEQMNIPVQVSTRTKNSRNKKTPTPKERVPSSSQTITHELVIEQTTEEELMKRTTRSAMKQIERHMESRGSGKKRKRDEEEKGRKKRKMEKNEKKKGRKERDATPEVVVSVAESTTIEEEEIISSGPITHSSVIDIDSFFYQNVSHAMVESIMMGEDLEDACVYVGDEDNEMIPLSYPEHPLPVNEREEDVKDYKDVIERETLDVTSVPLSSAEGDIVDIKPPRQSLAADKFNDQKDALLYYQVKLRFDDDVIPSQRNLRQFADIIQNRLIQRNDIFAKTTFSIFESIPSTFEADMLQIEEPCDMKEFKANLELEGFEENVLKSILLNGPHSNKTNAALTLRDSVSVVRLTHLLSQLPIQIENTFEEILNKTLPEDEMRQQQMLLHQEIIKQVKKVFVISFFVLSIGAEREEVYIIQRFYASLYEGWTGWIERGGIYRLYSACKDRLIGHEYAQLMAEKIEKRVRKLVLPFKQRERGKSIVYFVENCLNELDVTPQFKEMVENSSTKRSSQFPYRCGHSLGMSRRNECLLTFTTEEQLALHNELSHKKREDKNKKCKRCIRYFMLNSSRQIHMELSHHDYDDNEDE